MNCQYCKEEKQREMIIYGADRNGTIEEFSPDHWQVHCKECDLVYSRPFSTYQEASIWFTWHLENDCSPLPETEGQGEGLFQRETKVL